MGIIAFMIELDNKTSLDIDIDLLEDIANAFSDKLIELIVTDNNQIKEINKEYRSINKATDVLSFPYEDMPMSPLGSIIVSYDYIKQVSSELGHSEEDEFKLLFIHGLLHLLGYDHEVDNGEMRDEELNLIEKYNLPKSLIVRTQG